jgi:hypothetical protein
MRADEPRSFGDPKLVDVADEAQVRTLAQRYAVEPHEIVQAVQEAGPHLTAVELWLGCASLEPSCSSEAAEPANLPDQPPGCRSWRARP